MTQSSSELESFDSIMKDIKPMLQPAEKIHGRDLNMGSRSTPVLSVEGEKLAISVFSPGNKKFQPYYSRSILLQSLVFKQQGELSYPAPKREIHLRRDSLTEDTSKNRLEELEHQYHQFREVAYQLHPAEAESLGFSKNFVRRLKIRRTGRALASFLRIAEN